MANDMKKFEDIFVGIWKWDRDENLADAMKKMGYPEEEIKMYCSLKPTITIERRGEEVYMKFDMTKDMAHDCQFKFDEEFETKDNIMKPPTFHNKEVASFKDGVMSFKAKTMLTGPGKVDMHSDMFVKDGELHAHMGPLDDTSYYGNRIFKRA
ncbi:uncharacterized protein LOC128558149 [Mercenaria mercenaria]|uniref:uncharacterized protein LOC128558149 n=1 Tax=Mercenaria mercenaria TaxID=6596 RepID=UPI00234E670B|nr:uncharacterized protein LOC128558149 [Mercenaria mercenaria]